MLSWSLPMVTARLVLATTTLALASRPAGTVVSAAAIDMAATDSVAAMADATTVPISGPGARRTPASIQPRIRTARPRPGPRPVLPGLRPVLPGPRPVRPG